MVFVLHFTRLSKSSPVQENVAQYLDYVGLRALCFC